MKERVQKIMAHAGIASRRKCEEFIKKGKVSVNGSTITIGDKADIQKDVILVDGKKIKVEKKVYFLVHKPSGILSATADKRGKTIIDVVGITERVYPVGRLDKDASGLMILTNDGDFANKIMHPSFNVRKRYAVTLDKGFSDDSLAALEKGVEVEERKVKVFEVVVEGKNVHLSIHEGRKHIVKNLFKELGYTVLSLQRIQIGNLLLTLEEGTLQQVTKDYLKEKIF
tara:strand:+ start:598 stop:1278 length:681 start_codon:yes stop_codon:yes gene_type:complete